MYHCLLLYVICTPTRYTASRSCFYHELAPAAASAAAPPMFMRVSGDLCEHCEGGSSDPREHFESCSDGRLHRRQPWLWRPARERGEENYDNLIRGR